MPDVYWLIAAQRSFLSSLMSDPRIPSDRYRTIYERLCRVLAATFRDAAAVVVRERLHGYRNRSEIHILLVEAFGRVLAIDVPGDRPVQAGFPDFAELAKEERCRPTRTSAHIVKIVTLVPRPGESEAACRTAEAARLNDEIDAWESVRPVGLTHHSVLMVLRCGARDANGQLESIVYEDAHHVMGGRHIVHLEDAVLDCVRWGLPRVDSLKLTIKCIYEQLGNDFYARSYVLPAPRDGAGPVKSGSDEEPGAGGAAAADVPPPEDSHARIKADLARYLSAWRDELDPGPTPQPERLRTRREVVTAAGSEREGFLDPADYLRSVLECPQFCPRMLWGPSHGDLHGHNVLLSLADGDATLPALYDYEDMGPGNLIGLDFVKLETELKVRGLALAYTGPESGYLKKVYEFERHLSEWTHALHDGKPFRVALDDADAARLAELVMAIRAAAQEHMGRRRHRDREWLEEYYFLLALYAVRAGRFETWQRRHLMAGWISGGVAARLLTRPYHGLMNEIRMHERSAAAYRNDETFDLRTFERERPACEMSHHARLAFARTWCRSGEPSFIEAAARLLEQLRAQYPHVLEIEEELALQYLELERRPLVEELVEQVSRRYHLSEEMLCRMGRHWKDHGADQRHTNPPQSAICYRQALLWYERAYALRSHYYPGINVATLHFLLNLKDEPRASEVAQAVLASLELVSDPKERPWVLATRGEACLLLGDDPDAESAYQAACDEMKSMSGGNVHGRKTARRQAELIIERLSLDRKDFWTLDRLDDVFGRDARP